MTKFMCHAYYVLLALLVSVIFLNMETLYALIAIGLLFLLELSAREKHFKNAMDSVTAYVSDIKAAANDVLEESKKLTNTKH